MTNTNLTNLWWQPLTVHIKLASYLHTVRQTTQNDVSPSFYVLIRWSTYRMSQKCKTDTSFDVSNHFFLNWLSSWEFGKEIFSKLERRLKQWNSSFKKISQSKTQVISFLNLKHIIESRGVSVILNLVFYVFNGKHVLCFCKNITYKSFSTNKISRNGRKEGRKASLVEYQGFNQPQFKYNHIRKQPLWMILLKTRHNPYKGL